MNGPAGTNAIGAAVGWVQSALLGSAATIVAIVAVASIGFLMLTGHIDLRRTAQVVIGCFIIFGASTIAAGIQSFVAQAGAGSGLVREAARPELAAPLMPSEPQPPAQPYDPYAGAALAPR